MITTAELDEHHEQTKRLYAEVGAFIGRLDGLVRDGELSVDLAIEIAMLLQRMNNHQRETIKTTLTLLGQHDETD